MSKVKIQGHASGTGVLTVTAPNTSTDRTITLPDGTGTLLTTDGDGSNLTGINTDLVSDTSPQLGGDLASNGNDITMADNDKAKFGASDDLQIYHDGSHSWIKENGTGQLFIEGTELRLRTSAGANYFLADENGKTAMFYSGTEKLSTNSTGVDVSGTLAATAVTGDGSGLTNLPAAGETAAAWCSVYWNESIYESYNVSSITDVSVGKHYVNFDTDLSNSNYAIGGTGESNDCHIYHVTGKTASQYLVWTTNGGNNTRYDTNSSSIVFGD